MGGDAIIYLLPLPFAVLNKEAVSMIKVTRLNDIEMVVNAEKIQSVQATPDTLITFTNKDRLMVKEPVEELSRRILDYRRMVFQNQVSAADVLQQFPDLLH
jgi:flagellar protein FlbD